MFFSFRCVTNLEQQISHLDQEYDKCTAIWAEGEVSSFGKEFLGNNNLGVVSQLVESYGIISFLDPLIYNQIKAASRPRFSEKAEAGMKASTMVSNA